MKLHTQAQIAVKNILFATDFELLSVRALPFAVALADRYGAKLYLTHVVPSQAYAFAHPDLIAPILREEKDFASYKLNQILASVRRIDRPCEILVGEGDVALGITSFASEHNADLVVVATQSREKLGKLALGSIAEQTIREARCPVLTVGPRVPTDPRSGFRSIVCATDFSPASLRGVEYAASFACEEHAHLTLVHVVEGILRRSPHLALELTEKRLRECIPQGLELDYDPEIVVELGPVPERILGVARDLAADLIIIGLRGKRVHAERASHFGSIAHKVVSMASCPVLTVGECQPNREHST